MALSYKKMNLFDAPENAILAHACNCKGSWGAGIALEFQKRFPKAHKKYVKTCKESNGEMAGGATLTTLENGYHIACLFTSNGFGDQLDSKELILDNTAKSVRLLLELSSHKKLPIYSNKFNSGLFKVPWAQTSAILESLVGQYDIEWIVCEV